MTPNLFADPPPNLPEEISTTLLEASDVRIERIVSHGQCSPDGFWYDQDQAEWVLVLKGLPGSSSRASCWKCGPGIL